MHRRGLLCVLALAALLSASGAHAQNVVCAGELAARSINGNLLGNSIGGRLECERNRPAPLLVDNRVEGRAEGQCASLSTPGPPSTPSPGTPPAQPSPSPSPPSSPPSQPSPAPPSGSDSTTSSFVPQPEGGGGAAGVLEIGLLPLLLLGRFRRRVNSAGAAPRVE